MFDQQRHLLKTRCDLDLFGIQWRIVFQILMVLFGFFFICSATIKSLPAIRISRLTSCLKNLHVFHAKGSLVFFASLCHLSLVFISPRMLSVTQRFGFPRILKDLTGACCSSISLNNVSKARKFVVDAINYIHNGPRYQWHILFETFRVLILKASWSNVHWFGACLFQFEDN